MKALRSLFLSELADMYDSEHRITKALPKMIKASTSDKLQEALQRHLQETEGHVEKLERVFQLFNEDADAKKCAAMVGILDEGEDIVSDNKKTPSINAAIISACQKVEHYEIASYGTLHTWAGLLGSEAAADLLQEILDQEKETDRVLNDLAMATNTEALEEVAA